MKYFKRTEIIKPERLPKSEFQIWVTYDDGETQIWNDSEKEIFKFFKAYTTYIKRVEENWNRYCNPDTQQVLELFEEFKIDTEEYYEYWPRSNEYDCFARPSSVLVYYFDENSTQWELNEIS